MLAFWAGETKQTGENPMGVIIALFVVTVVAMIAWRAQRRGVGRTPALTAEKPGASTASALQIGPRGQGPAADGASAMTAPSPPEIAVAIRPAAPGTNSVLVPS